MHKSHNALRFTISRLVPLLFIALGLTHCQEKKPPLIKHFNKAGKMDTTFFIEGEKLVGPFSEYYESGVLKSVTPYKNGVPNGTRIRYYPSGKKEYELNIVDGIASGEFKKFTPNGTLEVAGTETRGKGRTTWYYPSGQIRKMRTIENDKSNGPFSDFRTNGKKRARGTMRNAKMNGIITRYDTLGKDSTRWLYEDGRLVRRL